MSIYLWTYIFDPGEVSIPRQQGGPFSNAHAEMEAQREIVTALTKGAQAVELSIVLVLNGQSAKGFAKHFP